MRIALVMTLTRLLAASFVFVIGCDPMWARGALSSRGNKPSAPSVVIDAGQTFFVVKKRGADALGCTPDAVSVESIGGSAWRVQGCEASAVVVCVHSTAVSCFVESVDRDEPQAAPSPVVVKSKAGSSGEFDRAAARAVLSSIPYRDCGHGGVGKLLLTFRGDGKLEDFRLDEGDFDSATSACIRDRFAHARVPPFQAERHTVSWSIRLSSEAEAATGM